MSDHHHVRESCVCDPDDFERLERHNDRDAFGRVFQCCLFEIKRRAPYLLHEECEDIAAEAISEVIEVLALPGTEAATKSAELTRALDRCRKRRIRARRHQAPIENVDGQRTSYNDIEDRIELEYWKKVVARFQGFVSSAFDLLRDRDHDLLLDFYKFHEVAPTNPSFRFRGAIPTHATAAARRQALSRARRKMSQIMEQQLEVAKMELENEKLVLEGVLRLVRGQDVAKALTAFRETGRHS